MPTFKSTVDAWIRQDRPAENNGSAAKLKLRGTGSASESRALLFFDPPFPEGATVLSATLRMFASGGWASSQDVTAKRITAKWRESQVDWNGKPTTSAAHSASATVTGGADKDEIDLDLALMMGDVANGDPFYGVELSLSANVVRAIYSSEYKVDNLRPVLDIEWAVPPEAPDNLKPSDGRNVGATKPTISWQFAGHDHDAPAEQTYSRVQVSSTDDFSAPSYDSGWVANTKSQWSLADATGPSFTAPADGDERFYRVQVKNNAGIASEWSDTSSWIRKSYGVLTLVNPPAPPSNQVSERTPPIDWTFTGRTQKSWRAELIHLRSDGHRETKFVWEKRVSSNTSFNIPDDFSPETKSKIGLQNGKDYIIQLRVWDDVDRQPIVGSLDYVSVERQFTYVRDGTPNPVTSVTVTQIDESPGVAIECERVEEPDFLQLVVNGEEVGGYIDPDDVLVSAGVFRIHWWRLNPRRPYDIEVEAVVLDAGKYKHSDGNAEATITVEPKGIWVIDEDDDTKVQILDQESADLSIRESATTYDIVGQRRPVRVTDEIGGYSGSISGRVLNRDARSDFLDMKGRLVPLRIVADELNFPATLEEVGSSPQPTSTGLYAVSASLFQVDEFDFDVKGS